MLVDPIMVVMVAKYDANGHVSDLFVRVKFSQELLRSLLGRSWRDSGRVGHASDTGADPLSFPLKATIVSILATIWHATSPSLQVTPTLVVATMKHPTLRFSLLKNYCTDEIIFHTAFLNQRDSPPHVRSK